MVDQPKVSLGPHAGKRLARLAAVQALYQAAFEQESVQEILTRMQDESFVAINGEERGEIPDIADKPDFEMVGEITRGAVEYAEVIEEMVASALAPAHSFQRIEKLLRAILCAGTYELYHHAEIPKGAIISDYVDVARAFFNDKEPALVNAVLDTLAAKLRS